MSKTAKLTTMPSLGDITFKEALTLARALSGKSFDVLSENTTIPRSTLQRMFTDPAYNPSVPNIPVLCDALGNTLLIDWQAAQVGAHLVIVESVDTDDSLAVGIARLVREFSDVLEADANARIDGVYTAAELTEMENQLKDLTCKSESLARAIRQRRKNNEAANG